jgi:hypothetical protein
LKVFVDGQLWFLSFELASEQTSGVELSSPDDVGQSEYFLEGLFGDFIPTNNVQVNPTKSWRGRHAGFPARPREV